MLQQSVIEILQRKIDQLESEHEFTLLSLAGPAWDNLSLQSGGASFGKYFKDAVLKGIIRGVRIVDDKQSPAIYKKARKA